MMKIVLQESVTTTVFVTTQTQEHSASAETML